MEFKIVQISGGLGNQMFQYAFAKSLQVSLDVPVLLDVTWFDGYSDLRELGLNLFNIDLKYANQQQIDYAKMMENKPKLIRSILKRLDLYRISNNIEFEYIPKLLKPSRLIYFRGCFQDPRYFASISSIIKQTFTPPPSPHKIPNTKSNISKN
ncbi:O-fucosyltransferase family protein [Helicobacter muridarum]|uniref:Alpha-1,2-fucosyltransferase n=1 Tax=Helicobacter muridarum TaxID=216 RepID=A0A377PXI4_9HELI|nr:alpha-1,2-fucosyltransferase [Helicobacter muridarum]STQ86961.1 alpha-1,2-fucosyltransferase [Helicobacter muridarum]